MLTWHDHFLLLPYFTQVMPQLLHFLRVDQHTSFNAAGGALASAAAAEAEAAAKGEGDVQPSSVDATSTEKPFLNSSDKVSYFPPSLLHKRSKNLFYLSLFFCCRILTGVPLMCSLAVPVALCLCPAMVLMSRSSS